MENAVLLSNPRVVRGSSRRLIRLATVCAAMLLPGHRATAVDDLVWSVPSHIVIASTGVLQPDTGIDPGASGSVTSSKLTATAPRPVPAEDLERLKVAAEHYQRGKVAEGDAALATINHAQARLSGEWLAVRSGAPAVSFSRIARFLDENPDFRILASVQKRAEEAMLQQRVAPARVLSFFATRAPVSGAGQAAQVLALKAAGRDAEAGPLVASLWREENLSRELEGMLLAAFSDALKQADHRNRMEMHLFRDNAEAALRSAARAGADHVKLAQARIAVARRSGGAAAALDAVPPLLRKDTSFLFARAQHLRRRQEAEGAANLIAGITRDPAILIDGDEWWVERRLIARQLLDQGKPALAYQVAAGHGAQKAQSVIEAEWHAGWIALRFLDDPASAERHFAAAAQHAATPISVARVAYWRGRAAEALGQPDAVRVHYEAAASQPLAYYGQIARTQLGRFDVPVRTAAAVGSAGAPHPVTEVAGTLVAAGAGDQARPLVLELARTLDSDADLLHLAAIARRIGETRLLVSLGKSAVQRGRPMDEAAFPITGLPGFEAVGNPVERAMVFAITRQESAFDAAAVSHAGARGLMQMMLPTARETARRVGLGFDAGRLTSDPAYNVRLGAAHLGDLIKDWRGSYVLTFAAYNAGSGNVRAWIDAYGDPRKASVDPIDWVERIPFTETRNYVQRVMENLQVYRTRLGDQPLLLIAQDLKRGSRVGQFAGEAHSGLAMAGLSAAD
ncbi:MAG: lytic transglycosylase domain-containing protein [Hyphomicrobiales bacterium]|nr:lytic transglycosylase domain-containing protein [Hyphomicrobiales bacterium]